MRENKSSEPSYIPYDLRYTTTRRRNSPTSSILKSPTPFFVTSRNSSYRTRRLKFANGTEGGEVLNDMREGSYDSVSTSTSTEISDSLKVNYDSSGYEDKLVEVSLSPQKKMQVSPESWNAFLEYQKYKDHSNETEKTDYTYSRLSKFRDKEIIPGFRIRPNLSRKPIHHGLAHEFFASGWSPEVTEYCVKKTVYETTSPTRRNVDADADYERSELFKNETSDYSRHDGYYSDGASRSDKKYQSFAGYDDDDGKVLRRGKGFGFNSFNLDTHSNIGTSWGYDETDDECITTTFNKDAASSNSVAGRVLVFLTAIYSTIFGGVSSSLSHIKNLFSKYILRRESYPQYAYSSTYWGPWSQSGSYSYGSYGKYRTHTDGRFSNWWYHSFLYALYSKMMSSVINSWNYVRTKYYRSSRKRKLLWFLLPLLLLLGFCIAFKDLFPNPDAILNCIRGSLSAVWSMTSHLFLVKLPETIFVGIPYLVATAIPNFLTVSLPRFVTDTIPYYFWGLIAFVSNLSLKTFLNGLLNPLIYAAEFIYANLIKMYSLTSAYLILFFSYFCVYLFELSGVVKQSFVSGLSYLYDFGSNVSDYVLGSEGLTTAISSKYAFWLMRAEGESAYVSNKVTAFKCRANQYISPARNHMRSVWKDVSSYSERIFGRSLEPIGYVFGLFTSIASALFDWALVLLASALKSVGYVFGFFKDLLFHFWLLFAELMSDAAEKKDAISSSLYGFFSGIFSFVFENVRHVLGALGSALMSFYEYFLPGYVLPQSDEVEARPFSGGLTSGFLADWESLRKRIEDLEIELRKVKEEKSAGTAQYQKQLEDNYKALQKYQLVVNDALRRQSSKPIPLSKTFIQYYLDGATDELKKWMMAHFMLKTDTNDIDENKFAMLMAKYSNKSEEELRMLQGEFSRFVRQYNAELSSLKTDLNVAQYQDFTGNDMSLMLIKRIVSDEIKLHDADKTGKVDYALQSAGGQVLGVKCTKNFQHCFKYSQIFFGLHVCAQKRKNAPEEAISPGMAPGQCWAFAGSQGFLTLELSHSIIVTGFTMEHISKMLSPNGRIESAPRMFSMWGLKAEFDMEPYLFGDYEYKDNNETYQYFPVVNYTPHPYKIVELNIASNHGNPNYTCLYRIRVHGDMYPSHV